MNTDTHISLGYHQEASLQDVVMLAADINYTHIHLANGKKVLVATTLKTLEKRLADRTDFLRIHKSYLVNINYIKAYRDLGDGLSIQMRNDYRVEVSRRKRKVFKERMNILNNKV